MFVPIWDARNARDPRAQAADSLKAEHVFLERFESLDAAQLDGFGLALFGMDVDAAGLAPMRLSEHALHSFDVAVALDPAAKVAPSGTSRSRSAKRSPSRPSPRRARQS